MEILRRNYNQPPTQQEVESWQNLPPSLVLVDLSKKCNLWCELHCGYPGQQLRREEKIAHHEEVEPLYTNPQLLKKAFTEIAETWDPKPSLQISADGEPLLHPQAKGLLTYAAGELGFNVGLTTNGILLKEKLVADLCRAGVKLINISLDAATAETYGVVRPERYHHINYFKAVTDNIAKAVEARNKLSENQQINTEFMITMIVRQQSQDEQQDFVELGKKLGVDKVSFRPLNSTAGLTPNFNEVLSEDEIVKDQEGVVRKVNGLNRYPCIFPFTRFSLTGGTAGSLKFVYCPHAWDRDEADIGYYPQDGSLKDLWNSALLNSIREAHLTGNFNLNSLCAACPDWRMVAGKDTITYANIVAGKK
ncbi:radical SAM protein [Candidatus Microgenomates bacterium]|nr:radical SAM protein [Candidatus Microgenomates bacterium]